MLLNIELIMENIAEIKQNLSKIKIDYNSQTAVW